MTVGVLEIQAAAVVPVVDHPRPALARICPVRQPLVPDAAKCRVEFLLANEEGVMLASDRLAGLGEVQRDAIVGLDDEEMREPPRCRQAEDPSQERCRPLLVTAGDDGVVQLHAHPVIMPRAWAALARGFQKKEIVAAESAVSPAGYLHGLSTFLLAI